MNGFYKNYHYEVHYITPKNYAYYIYENGNELCYRLCFGTEQQGIDAAKKAIDKYPQKQKERISNPYTSDIRPPYMWIPVENDLPPDLTRVLAVWECKYSKMISRSHIGFEARWKSLEHPGLNDNEHWRVTYWQYAPSLPT